MIVGISEEGYFTAARQTALILGDVTDDDVGIKSAHFYSTP